MPVKYFIWYIIVAGWHKTFRSAASWLAADLKVSCQPAGRRPRQKKTIGFFYEVSPLYLKIVTSLFAHFVVISSDFINQSWVGLFIVMD